MTKIQNEFKKEAAAFNFYQPEPCIGGMEREALRTLDEILGKLPTSPAQSLSATNVHACLKQWEGFSPNTPLENAFGAFVTNMRNNIKPDMNGNLSFIGDYHANLPKIFDLLHAELNLIGGVDAARAQDRIDHIKKTTDIYYGMGHGGLGAVTYDVLGR